MASSWEAPYIYGGFNRKIIGNYEKKTLSMEFLNRKISLETQWWIFGFSMFDIRRVGNLMIVMFDVVVIYGRTHPRTKFGPMTGGRHHFR